MINLASGVRWERLTPHSDPDVEFLYVVYPVGAESCPEDALVTHGGKEYGYVVSGRLGVRVGLRRVRARPRRVDRVRLFLATPALGDRREPVHAIWVVLGRGADPRAQATAQPS